MATITKINIRKVIEIITILFIFSILLYVGYGNTGNYKLKHEHPYGYFASDTFQHQVRAEAIKDAGNFRYEAPYISKGFDNVVGRYPPTLYHLGVLLSHASGLETFDTTYFLVFFFASIAAILMFFIIKPYNIHVAIISLPLSVLIFAQGSYMAFTWGHWPSLLSQFFLIAFFWSVMRIGIKGSSLLIGLFLAAMALTHTSELLFGILFLFFYLAVQFLSKKFKIVYLKKYLLASGVFIVLSLYYLIIFQNTWAQTQSYSFFVMRIWEGNPGLYLSTFGLLLIFMLVGFVVSVISINKIPFSIAIAMLIFGYTNYVGFHVRAFQIRFFWPIYISVFFGIGLFYLLKFFIKKWKIWYSFALFLIIFFFLVGIVKIPYLHQYEKMTSPGIMNQYHWEMFDWLSKNTEYNQTILFFYGDLYNQDAVLRNSKRIHYLVDPLDIISAINSGMIRRNYLTELPGDGGGSLGYRKSFFSFNDYSEEYPKEYFHGVKDTCIYNYYVFDKVSSQNIFVQYNQIIIGELLKNNFFIKVFENEVSIVLKNNNVGEDCIEEQTLG